MSKLATKSSVQLDYDCLPPKIFARFLKKIYDDKSIAGWRDKEVIIPIMASGHVKFMHNCENIDRILNEVNSSLQGKIVYWTLSDAIKSVRGRESRYILSKT